MRHSSRDCPYRFDLITVVWPPGRTPRIEHFEDAYRPRRG
jgi:hypothetical protein